MKIAMLTASCDKGLQAEGFIPDWINELASQTDELVVFTLSKPISPVRSNVKIYHLDKSTKLGKLTQLFALLANENHKKKFDGIFNHIFDFLAVSGALWARLNGVKSIYWYAGGIPFRYFSITSLALHLNELIVTCSEKEKKNYCRFASVSPHKIKVLGHGISAGHFKQLIKNKHKSFTIGYVCRATPKKNVETLIRAVVKVESDKPIHLKLALARFNENPEYATQIKNELENFNHQNRTYEILTNLAYKDLPEYYNSLDLYVHPSVLTSIDKAGLEAAMSGVPVLLSETSYGSTGISTKNLFNPNNVDELTKKITAYLNKSNNDNLEPEICENFSTKSLMSKLIKHYE